jgi:hypothetical protein
MAREIVFTSKAPKPSPTYSQAVKAAGLVFLSGPAPTDSETGQIKGTTIQERQRQCLCTGIGVPHQTSYRSVQVRLACRAGLLRVLPARSRQANGTATSAYALA